MDGKGEDETSENVVRLPREWVGPPEDLVPMGPRARARAREREAARAGGGGGSALDSSAWDTETSGDIPGAEDFWGEGASAVHDVVRAPSWDGAIDDRPIDPPAPTESTPRSRPRPRAPRAGARRPSPRALLGAAAGLILLVAVTGLALGGTNRHPARAPAARASMSAGFIDFSRVRDAAQTATEHLGAITRRAGRVASAREQHHDLRLAAESARVDERILHAALTARRPSSNTHQVTVSPSTDSSAGAGGATTTAPPPSTTPEAPTPTSSSGLTGTTSTSSGSSGSGSSGSHPVFGSGGMLGAGHAG